MKKTILSIFILSAFFFSCKKDDTASLKGVWSLENTVTKIYNNNVLSDTQTEPGTGEKIYFKDGGVYTATTPGEPDENGTYTISGSKVTIDGQVLDIQNLTNSKVSLFSSMSITTDTRYDISINLKR